MLRHVSFSLSVSPSFSPCLPVYIHHSPSYSSSFFLASNPSHAHILVYIRTHMHIHIHIDTKCVPCFRSFCVPSFDSSSSSSSCSSSRPVPSSRLVFVPHEHTDSELPYRVSRSENSSVGPGQESLMNLRLEVSPDSRAVDTGRN